MPQVQNSEPIVPALNGSIQSASLDMTWSEAPWDSTLFNAPVLQIDKMSVRGKQASHDIKPFTRLLDDSGVHLVSCRLTHDRLAESFLLEELGFRFIEMTFQPELNIFDFKTSATLLNVQPASEEDLPRIIQIAGSAFTNERFHVDPRLSPALGNQRYRNWVCNALNHKKQKLYAIRDSEHVVSFFVVERLGAKTCYWHLNAIASEFQGKGYGRRTWETMIEHARWDGDIKVCSSIVARNHRVLNLYASLGFRFPPPNSTFHWVRSS